MAVFDPKEEFRRLQENMKKLLLNLNAPFSSQMRKTFGSFKSPQSDITQNVKKLVINIELPEIKEGDVKLNITKKYVEVVASKNSKKIKKMENSYLKDDNSISFYRMLALPRGFNHKKAKAIFKNGLLRIELPRIKKKKDG
jgi:HSP20 family protein